MRPFKITHGRRTQLDPQEAPPARAFANGPFKAMFLTTETRVIQRGAEWWPEVGWGVEGTGGGIQRHKLAVTKQASHGDALCSTVTIIRNKAAHA